MTQLAMDCAEARVSLGVYVLGAIEPAERPLVDAHLAGCRDCRDELAGLAGLPALLARVSTEEAIALAATGDPPVVPGEQQEPPGELLGTVLDLTAARRRRARRMQAALGAAAALIIAAGVFGGLRAAPGPAAAGQSGLSLGVPGGPWRTSAGQAAGMTVTVMYRPMGWGTQLAAKVTGIPPGVRCQMFVVGPGGARTPDGSWVVDEDAGRIWYPMAGGFSAAAVHGFVVTVGTGQAITIPV